MFHELEIYDFSENKDGSFLTRLWKANMKLKYYMKNLFKYLNQALFNSLWQKLLSATYKLTLGLTNTFPFCFLIFYDSPFVLFQSTLFDFLLHLKMSNKMQFSTYFFYLKASMHTPTHKKISITNSAT